VKVLVVAALLLGTVLTGSRPVGAQAIVGPICIHVTGAYVAALLLFATQLPFQQMAVNGFRHWGPTLPVYGSAFLVSDQGGQQAIFALTVGPEATPPYTPTVFLSGRFDVQTGLGFGQCSPDSPPSPCTAGGHVTYALADCDDRAYPN
jgi:hypothetical protein